jgi:hypothetical protein
VNTASAPQIAPIVSSALADCDHGTQPLLAFAAQRLGHAVDATIGLLTPARGAGPHAVFQIDQPRVQVLRLGAGGLGEAGTRRAGKLKRPIRI